jgi:hypothetical protein
MEREAEATEPAESLGVLQERLGLTREEIAPYLAGDWCDYTHFRNYRDLLVRLRPLVALASRLRLVPENLVRKLTA